MLVHTYQEVWGRFPDVTGSIQSTHVNLYTTRERSSEGIGSFTLNMLWILNEMKLKLLLITNYMGCPFKNDLVHPCVPR